MKKLKNKIFLLISFIAMTISALPLFSASAFKEAKADTLNNVGEVSISECIVYDPFANNNHFLMLKLEGSDYPVDASAKEINKSTLSNRFTPNISEALQFYNIENTKLNITDYYSVYSNQHHYASCFSIWLDGLGGARMGIIKKEFKIPSFALLNNDTSSPTYGYYTLNMDYQIYAEDLNYALMKDGFHNYIFGEYNPRQAYVNSIYTYVDNGHEMLTFGLTGLGIDYPNDGNKHFDVTQIDSILSNFKSKVHLYKEDGTEMTYDFEQFVLSINLWGVKGRVSISIADLVNAKRVYVEEGLILPSEARRNNNTSSSVYDGFIIQNSLDLTIDPDTAHETGAIIKWGVHIPTLSELSLAKVESNNPWGNNNEFVMFTFNEVTDFTSIPSTQWSVKSVDLLTNLTSHIKLYDQNNSEISVSIPLNTSTAEAYFNFEGRSNCLTLMFGGFSNVRKVVLSKGFIIPSYSLYINDHTSSSFGNYVLGLDYEITLDNSASHFAGSTNNWSLPSCSIKYFDEDEATLLKEENAVLGSTYHIASPIVRVGYKSSWELKTTGIEINEDSFVVPLTIQEIIFKANFVEIKTCHIEYYSENNDLIEELCEDIFCGETYTISPLISKKGHDASWVIIEPVSLQVVNNTITIPDDVELIKIKAHYEARTFKLSFVGVEADPIYIQYNQRIGTLPAIPTEPYLTANWMIDGEIISEDSLYIYDENKTATISLQDRYCLVTFNSNGGSEIEDIKVLYGNTINELPLPIKEGYYFENWYLDEELSNAFDKLVPVQNDMTLYAKWKVECVVTFDSDGGSQVESIHLGAGDKISNPLSPTKEGYEFLYWMLNGKEFDFNNPITESITLVAKWNKIQDVKPDDNPKPSQSINGGQIAIIITASVISLAGLAFLGIMLFKKKKV